MSPIRVCVLISSFEGSDSPLGGYDAVFVQTPQHYFAKDDLDFTFTTVAIKKATSYRQVRALVKSGEYDIFYNQCDGAKDEDRAGEDVVRALEEFSVPFTGATSKYYEISKPDMKMISHYARIPTARYAVLEVADEARTACTHLRFPVIIKHISGYSSIGMTKDSKCETMEQLVSRADLFIKEFQYALVEEFVQGDEATVLACADATAPDGVRVYHPVKVRFPPGEDFKHFQLKWEGFEGMEWERVADDDPALPQIMDIGRRAFKEMMGGVGYGRCDLRIDRTRNEVVFLEINPNCGIMYPPGQEGSADWILRLTSEERGHRDFAALQVREALARHERERPLYRRAFDQKREFHLRATQLIKQGTVIFQDEGRPLRVYTRPYIEATWPEEAKRQFHECSWPLGADRHYYAVWDTDPAQWRSFNHSCEPNMAFGPQRSLNVVALRDIVPGEELTMDYRSFSDDAMSGFVCNCGAPSCQGVIEPKQPRLTPPRVDRTP